MAERHERKEQSMEGQTGGEKQQQQQQQQPAFHLSIPFGLQAQWLLPPAPRMRLPITHTQNNVNQSVDQSSYHNLNPHSHTVSAHFIP